MMSLWKCVAIWIPACFWIICMSGVSGQFDPHFTLQNVWSRLTPDERSLIQCVSHDANYKKIKFSRVMDTGQGSRMTMSSRQFLQGTPVFARILLMPADDRLSRVGVYDCKILQNNTATQIVTLKLPPASLAELDAVSPYVVSSVGDDVELEVKATRNLDLRTKWTHNGKAMPNWDGIMTVQFVGIESKDAGIYECFYEGRRNESLHAIMRVIVRGCPKDLYGDDCDKECPPCYNGGVCHDKWGVCVCPAGFTGSNCERACGGNRYGANCYKFCSPPQNSNNTDELCSMHLFCKPDPYGCSCAPGFKGSKCTEQCEPGWYGADCKQHCQCAQGASNCNRITGACEGGCTNGFRGPSCQIEVELDAVSPLIVASVGDDVELQVTEVKSLPLPIKWTHDGVELPSWDGMTTVRFVDIELKDAGTYECYYEGRKIKNAHAIIRVDVKAVQATDKPPMPSCQCNLSSILTYMHDMRVAVTYHFNYLRQRQVEMEEAIRRIEQRREGQGDLESITLPKIPHTV